MVGVCAPFCEISLSPRDGRAKRRPLWGGCARDSQLQIKQCNREKVNSCLFLPREFFYSYFIFLRERRRCVIKIHPKKKKDGKNTQVLIINIIEYTYILLSEASWFIYFFRKVAHIFFSQKCHQMVFNSLSSRAMAKSYTDTDKTPRDVNANQCPARKIKR